MAASPTYESFSRREFAARYELADWRILAFAIEAQFVAPSLAEAASFVGELIAEADRIQHHPDVELGYPGRVRLRLTTHATGGLTDLDAELARWVSRRAAERGFRSERERVSRIELAIDALDIPAVLPFWRTVLDYVDDRPNDEGIVDAIVDPLRVGPVLWFQQMDAPRPQRSRTHLDLRVPGELAEARVAAAIAAGGRLVTDEYAPAFWVLADAEGNEICICTWRGRD